MTGRASVRWGSLQRDCQQILVLGAPGNQKYSSSLPLPVKVLVSTQLLNTPGHSTPRFRPRCLVTRASCFPRLTCFSVLRWSQRFLTTVAPETPVMASSWDAASFRVYLTHGSMVLSRRASVQPHPGQCSHCRPRAASCSQKTQAKLLCPDSQRLLSFRKNK